MLKIEKNKPLAQYTTLKIALSAQYFSVIRSKADLLAAISWAARHKKKIYILGGGSNLLFSQPVKGLVIKNEIFGRSLLSENDNEIILEGKSGQKWSAFVDYTVRQGWHGLENLSLIYGTLGAAPVQNIGAYGAELKDSFDHLVAIDLVTGQEKIFNQKDCRFGYRDSIFKGRLKGRYFIYKVAVRLKKKAPLLLDYGSIRETLLAKNIKNPQLSDVANVIKDIRRSKLPNPEKFPNAGSFFKNIEISKARYRRLVVKNPDMPGWPLESGRIKIPSGWLIEAVGFKGRRIGPLGMHERQALVMVNYGQASPRQAINFSQRIKSAIKEKFGLDLIEEINII